MNELFSASCFLKKFYESVRTGPRKHPLGNTFERHIYSKTNKRPRDENVYAIPATEKSSIRDPIFKYMKRNTVGLQVQRTVLSTVRSNNLATKKSRNKLVRNVVLFNKRADKILEKGISRYSCPTSAPNYTINGVRRSSRARKSLLDLSNIDSSSEEELDDIRPSSKVRRRSTPGTSDTRRFSGRQAREPARYNDDSWTPKIKKNNKEKSNKNASNANITKNQQIPNSPRSPPRRKRGRPRKYPAASTAPMRTVQRSVPKVVANPRHRAKSVVRVHRVPERYMA